MENVIGSTGLPSCCEADLPEEGTVFNCTKEKKYHSEKRIEYNHV